MMILRAKNLRTVCTLAMLVCAYAAPDAQAQIPGLDRLKRPSIPAPPAAPSLTGDSAAAQAATDCVQAGKEDQAAGIALLFGGSDENGTESSDVSKYLVGLCVPPSLSEQYALNEYLLAKGAMHSFYSERSLEELAAYLQTAGVELGVKFEALQKDSALMASLSASNGIDKAAFLFNQNQKLAENAALFLPALAKLQTDQRTSALGMAARVRSHALNSSYFLSRGVYVSQKMAGAIANNAKTQAGGLRSRLRGSGSDPLAAASAVADETGAQVEQLRSFGEFVKKNGKAVAGTLSSTINVVKSFDTDAAEIPKLAKEELAADVKRLNDTWDFPAEFRDEATYGPANTLVES
jgi:hypothetical protein